MKVYLCTFATAEYAESAEVLRHSALTFGGFDGAFVYAEPDLAEVRKVLPEGLAAQKRGHMLWSWKPYVILDALRRVEDGDVVVYCDAAMYFAGSFRDRLGRLLRHDDVSLIRNEGHRNRDWCKRDCFVAMDCDETPFHDATQINAAIQAYRKTPRALNFLEEYRAHCSNERAMDDFYRVPNYEGFVDHRHDQSVLTNLSVVHAPHVAFMDDPTQFGKKSDAPIVDHHRQRLGRVVRTTVITATTGAASLTRCIESVQAQTLMGVTHLIVVDGPEFAAAVEEQVAPFRFKKPIEVLVLPRNTGRGGWNGHRIYGAMPFLTDDQYVAFLDEDNWYAPEHLMGLMQHVQTHKMPWTFSLRAIHSAGDAANGSSGAAAFVANDACESLGNMAPTVLGDADFLVDTSCMLLETRVAVDAAAAWYQRERGHDRAYTAHLLAKHPRISGVPRHTVRYAAGSSAASVSPDFFVKGNAIAGYDFEKKKTLYVFHFNPEATRAAIAFLREPLPKKRSVALAEWQPGMLVDLAASWNVVDGYAAERFIPPGSVVYVSMCLPHQLPFETLRRDDLVRVGYTIESPNIRHREQWTESFLRAHFDRVLTYWTPLLVPGFAVFCPQNTHHLDFSNPHDVALLKPLPDHPKRNACMVLERRPHLRGTYDIDGEVLTCLDPLREHYVKDLTDVTVFGVGWADAAAGLGPGVKIGHSMHRSKDPRSSVDIIKDFTFTIIVENTDADGYVSEKIYDALIACSIPVYYGNNNDRVGIPRDMYIDLRRFPTSRALDDHLQKSMTAEDIRDMQHRIVAGRRAVLERVSTRAFADALLSSYQ